MYTYFQSESELESSNDIIFFLYCALFWISIFHLFVFLFISREKKRTISIWPTILVLIYLIFVISINSWTKLSYSNYFWYFNLKMRFYFQIDSANERNIKSVTTSTVVPKVFSLWNCNVYVKPLIMIKANILMQLRRIN